MVHPLFIAGWCVCAEASARLRRPADPPLSFSPALAFRVSRAPFSRRVLGRQHTDFPDGRSVLPLASSLTEKCASVVGVCRRPVEAHFHDTEEPPTRRNISSHRRDEIYRLAASSALVATLVSRLSSTTEIRSLTTASILCFTSLLAGVVW